jgi:O-antigen ligase
MQSANVYPLWQPVSAAAPARSGIVAYLRAFTVAVWFGSLVLNYWWRQHWDWSLQFAEEGVNLRDHYMVGFAVALAGHLTLGIQAWLAAPFRVMSTASGKLFTLFCLVMLVLSPLSASFRSSGAYAIATWLVFVLCHLYWSSDYTVVRRMLVFSGMLLIVWVFALLLHHGLPRGFGGGIGGINRNTTSSLGLAGMICCALSPKRSIRWGGMACCALLSVMVTSRGTIVAMGVFLAIYYALHKGTIRAIWHAVLAVFLMSAVLLASSFLQQFILEDVMKLHDKARGMGSGFTGRWETWVKGLDTFWKKPLAGHGFRAQVGGAQGLFSHGGYVTLLIETGIIGTLLAVSAVIVEAVRRMNRAMQLRTLPAGAWQGIDREESLRINTIVCATMCTMLTLWVYEPLYLNLGTAMSLVFFLMFGSPELVTIRPTSMRSNTRRVGRT